MKILVTGTAGFIGFHLVEELIKEKGDEIIGLDNINDYYDVNLKFSRLEVSGIEKSKISYNKLVKSNKHANYSFIKLNIEDKENLTRLFAEQKFDKVIHLAAQAGVRYSLENPQAYIDSNITGFFNILDNCKNFKIKHLIYASSSSVYGLNKEQPFCTDDNVDHPISLYAASKKSNELMAHVYSHLFNIPTTGLRFFTVYGPWGRPDMSPIIFADAISNHKPLKISNGGNIQRDFTYISDIVDGILLVNKKEPEMYKIYNIGSNNPVNLMDFINLLEKNLGTTTGKNFQPLPPGDVVSTFANIDDLIHDFNYKPSVDIETGVSKFTDWYKEYYKIIVS